MKSADGYIKFNINYSKKECPLYDNFTDLNNARSRLHKKKYIGVLPSGIGYGNISMRIGSSGSFLITGSKTGYKKQLEISDYSEVYGFDIGKNEISCCGMCKASSESLSHAAIYLAAGSVNCVIHIHNKKIWEFLLDNNFPATSKDAEYGTPEIAEDIFRLIKGNSVKRGIFPMAGHTEGVIAFGGDILKTEKLLTEGFLQTS